MDPDETFAALYRDTVLEHGRAPRHVGALAAPTGTGTASNALCGDRVEVDVCTDADGALLEVGHRTVGCLICTASASLMCEEVMGLPAAAIDERWQALRAGIASGDGAALGRLAALTGVSAHPTRHRCALLPWEALQAALAAPEPA
jgi:nitrogen fixation NifU-like protein